MKAEDFLATLNQGHNKIIDLMHEQGKDTKALDGEYMLKSKSVFKWYFKDGKELDIKKVFSFNGNTMAKNFNKIIDENNKTIESLTPKKKVDPAVVAKTMLANQLVQILRASRISLIGEISKFIKQDELNKKVDAGETSREILVDIIVSMKDKQLNEYALHVQES